jgi:hypothetical protein
MFLYWILSSDFSFHLLIPKFRRSASTVFSHLTLCLQILLIPSSLENVTFLHGYDSSLLNRCPSHVSLLFINFIISGSSDTWYNSYLLHHSPMSIVGPYIFLSVFLANILIYFCLLLLLPNFHCHIIGQVTVMFCAVYTFSV